MVRRPEHTTAASGSIQFVLEEDVLTKLRLDVYKKTITAERPNLPLSYDGHVVRVGDGMGVLTVAQLTKMDRFYTEMMTVHRVIVVCEWLSRLSFPHVDFSPFTDVGTGDQVS